MSAAACWSVPYPLSVVLLEGSPGAAVDVVHHLERRCKRLDLAQRIVRTSDSGERDDTVGPYGKSLLFLVSNAFERRRETPLLGMERKN